MRQLQIPVGVSLSDPQNALETQIIHKTLKRFSEQDLAELMKLSPRLAAQSFLEIHTFGSTTQALCPAILSYSGDVYKGLDAETLTSKQLNFAQKHLAILSGMYGVLRPLDGIHSYRLEMGLGLSVGKTRSLYKFWEDKIAATVKSMSKGPYLNLCSEEYFSAVSPWLPADKVIHFHFREKANGKLQFKSVFAKKARGLMARYMIDNQITKPDDLKSFNIEGYGFDPSVSDEKNWIFVR